MIILITGASHTGKTALAQKLLEKYKYPYLSIDHLKMGLIRSGSTLLTPMSDDDELTAYLWPIALEMIKTAIENQQNLIVEGCYIPFNWKEYFDDDYKDYIKYVCLIFSESYINNHFDSIVKYANTIENRIEDSYLNISDLVNDNKYYLENCIKYSLNSYVIDDKYDLEKCIDVFISIDL